MRTLFWGHIVSTRGVNTAVAAHVCVCLSVGNTAEVCKNGRTDRDAVWRGKLVWTQMNFVLDGSPDLQQKWHSSGTYVGPL